jgi:hypothetical protein
VPQLVAQQGLARPAYVIIETRDRDGEVPGRRGAVLG